MPDYIESFRVKNRVKTLTLDTAGNIPATTGTLVTEIRAPKGEIWKVLFLTARAFPPTGGVSGTHRIEIMLGVNDTYNRVVYGYNDWNLDVYFSENYFKTAKAPMEPPDIPSQIKNMGTVVITDESPLYIKYSNLTNVVQDKGLVIRAVIQTETI